MKQYRFRVTYSDGYSTELLITSSHPNSAFAECVRQANKNDRDAGLAKLRWVVRAEHIGRGVSKGFCMACGHDTINGHCIECGQDLNPLLDSFAVQGLTGPGIRHNEDEVMDEDERKQKIFRLIERMAAMTPDQECLAHGDCEGNEPDCRLFDMTNDDAVETLNLLIREARELHEPTPEEIYE